MTFFRKVIQNPKLTETLMSSIWVFQSQLGHHLHFSQSEGARGQHGYLLPMHVPLVKTVPCLHLRTREAGQIHPAACIGRSRSLDFGEQLAVFVASIEGNTFALVTGRDCK